MAVGELSDEALMAALRAHPELRERVSSIVRAVEGDEGELKEADAAEERIVEEMRLLGREALKSWAESRVEATEREFVNARRCIAKAKKTPLAYEIRRNRGFGAAISVRDAAGAPIRARGESEPARVFAAAAARHRRLCRRSAFRSGARQAGGALRLRDRREHDPAGHFRPCPGDVWKPRRDLEFPETVGFSKPIVVKRMAA